LILRAVRLPNGIFLKKDIARAETNIKINTQTLKGLVNALYTDTRQPGR
jgi:hypothetical protein